MQTYAELQEQEEVRQEEAPPNSRPGSPAREFAQPAGVMQGLSDLQLERESRAGEQVGGVCQIFYAKKADIYNADDKEFVENFIASKKGEMGYSTLRNHFAGLAKLSNVLTSNQRDGFAGRLADRELDDVATRLDSGFFKRGKVRAALAAAREYATGGVYEEDRILIDSLEGSEYDAYRRNYALAIRNFSAWLRLNDLPAINGRIHALDNDIDTYLADPNSKGSHLRKAIAALRAMGLGQQQRAQPDAGPSQPADWGGATSVADQYGQAGFGATSPPSSFFEGISWPQLQTPGEEVSQPYMGSSQPFWNPPDPWLGGGGAWASAADQYGQAGFGATSPPSSFFEGISWPQLQTPGEEVSQPYMGSSQPFRNPPPPSYADISGSVGDDWQHGSQRASNELVGVLENNNLMPTPYVPQTYMYIHGQRYMATWSDGELWLIQRVNVG
ncbi:hypothetical protein [Paraburkholderia youngii]|uniref:Uncharacterized protein n=1 Tax=Paraburkholderia youngii TaxID=2782701 RepID=A0A7Y6N565_9BURK|nr:hypothetical protein [Paraburkholderia youngii]NUY06259.1 hypothetical protein [Paraburkholderia youngii]